MPGGNQPLPRRPASPAHSKVLTVVGEFWEFLMDRTHDEIVELIGSADHEVTETIRRGFRRPGHPGPRITFKRGEQQGCEPDPAVPGTIRRGVSRSLA